MADESLEATVEDNDSLELEVNPPYVGSAYSPEVDIEETSSTITVTITDARGDHSYSVPNPTSAIEDAQAATTAANNAAGAATSAAGAAGTATTAANNAATAASDAASTANTKAALAAEKAAVAVQAASDANSAAETAAYKAGLANTAASAANSAATAAGNAAAAALSAVDYADTATRDAAAAADAANSAADNANDAAGAAEAATATVDAAVASANSAAAYANNKGGAAANAANAANDAATLANAKAGAANDAATLANQKATAANTAAGAANDAAELANTKAGLANTAATAANNAAEAANTAAEYASEFTEAYMPLVTSGAAESLLSTDEQTATFTQRTSDHDGSVGVRAIKGNTVVWNQLCSGAYIGAAPAGLTKTINSDGSLTYTGTLEESISNNNLTLSRSVALKRDGRKYLCKCSKDIGLIVRIGGFASAGTTQSFIFSDNGGGTYTGAICAILRVDESIDISNVFFMIIDLTLMFGAGNEPATVAEFEALYPESYYPYNAGELVSVNIEGITSTEQTREIPASTYFPNGMRGVGTAHDALYRDHADTAIGAVDLSTINWTLNGQYWAHWTALPNCKTPSDNGNRANIKHATLPTLSYNNVASNIGIGIGTAGYVLCNNDSTTDKPTGLLIYELANPTTTEIDPPLNMDYQTQQGGVESIVVPTGEMSAPMPLVYVQGYDADGVADKALSVIAPLEGAKASANYAIGSYFVHAGKLYKATSAIATGETITPGTNCALTTVMAEIMTLA